MAILETVTLILAQVTGVAVELKGSISMVQARNALVAGANWVTLYDRDTGAKQALSVPVGTTVEILVAWGNLSNVNMKGHIDLLVTAPNGSQWPITPVEADKVAVPGAGKQVLFQPVQLGMQGSYSAQVTLSGEVA